jgi:hypothetical protein
MFLKSALREVTVFVNGLFPQRYRTPTALEMRNNRVPGVGYFSSMQRAVVKNKNGKLLFFIKP